MKYETHAHTAEISPCAKLKAAETAAEVAGKGFDCLIVTDHYTPDFFTEYTCSFEERLHEYFAGYRAAADAGKVLGLTVLPALEVRIESGLEDYLVFGIGEAELAKLGCLSFMSIDELSNAVRSTEHGLLVQAHPFRRYCNCAESKYLDGIEVVNGNPRHDSHNKRSIAFARENGLIETAGSDVHEPGDAGLVWMEGPECRTIEEFADALKTGVFTWHAAEECFTE